jgi:hypothetical protein
MYPKFTPLSVLISIGEVWEHNASLSVTKAHIVLIEPSRNEKSLDPLSEALEGIVWIDSQQLNWMLLSLPGSQHHQVYDP